MIILPAPSYEVTVATGVKKVEVELWWILVTGAEVGTGALVIVCKVVLVSVVVRMRTSGMLTEPEVGISVGLHFLSQTVRVKVVDSGQ